MFFLNKAKRNPNSQRAQWINNLILVVSFVMIFDECKKYIVFYLCRLLLEGSFELSGFWCLLDLQEEKQ